MPSRYLFVQLCAREEGFGIPGAVPTRNNNPMDLRHSPHSSHAGESPNAIGIIDSLVDGWADADRQAERWAARGLTIGQAIDTQLGIMRNSEGEVIGNPDANNWQAYLAGVLIGLREVWQEGLYGAWMAEHTPLRAALLVPAAPAVVS